MMITMTAKEIADKRLKQSCEFIQIESRDHWLQLRKLGIGGSDVAGIFNQSPFMGRRDVYLSKMDNFIPKELDSDVIDFGNDIEDPAVQIFQARYKYMYTCVNYKDIMFRNYFITYFQASLDSVLVNDVGQVGILEVKSVNPSAIRKWYNNDGSPTVPIYYLFQGLHYLNTTGLDFIVYWALANVSSGDTCMRFLEPRIYTREQLKEQLEIAKNECINFWVNNVKVLVEPGIKL